ncbi:MAG: M23 family metallopeptidase [Ignavibacteriales bacterium]|nr:M23 family metallopeptidase [Ignavibacteriales bacterium]
MSKFRLYYFSPRTLTFVEARWFKAKLALLSVVLGMVFLAVMFETNQALDDALGLGIYRNTSLRAENVLLKNQMKMISARLETLQKKLLAVHEQGNELRLLADLPRIDEDTRMAGVGGTDERIDFGVSPSVNDLLNGLRSTVDRAERELSLQQVSYGEAVEGYKANMVKFAHIPAIKPMEGYYRMHGFGLRKHPIFNVVKPHEGIDIANDTGTPIYATGNGTVSSAGRTQAGFGNMIILNHGFGYSTLYGHLSKVMVRPGQTVERGDLIGRCGSTGISTNPHLHYEVRLNGVLQNPVDFFFDDIDYQKIKQELALND